MTNHPFMEAEIMAYTASKTWISHEAREQESWVKIRDNLARIAPLSPFTPKTFLEWIDHRLDNNAEEMERTLAKIAKKKDNKVPTVPVCQILGGRKFNDHLSLVLARGSIWRPREEPAPGRRLAVWPTYEEFKHEGDDRFKSGYSRFPPLPRDPGNETVNWKQRKPLSQFPFDQIGHPSLGPDAETVEPFTGPEEKALGYIGGSLLALLDP